MFYTRKLNCICTAVIEQGICVCDMILILLEIDTTQNVIIFKSILRPKTI